ncbi:cupin domain-containing protein [Micrococcus luteus]|uniref:cupin domain-containing protein n=1 Tax=Micrococcus luteus TaxID=1270 RepID=UPI000AC49218|nr:cupin domain-containing protein [Micrococcus luteus]
MHVTQPTTLTSPGAPAVDLFADSSDLNGAASIQRLRLPARSLGASPHLHRRSSELFYVLDGAMWFLQDHEVLLAEAGSLVVIHPNTAHAFAAADEPAAALIVLTPGVERFGYFRLLAAVAAGLAAPEELREAQDRFDNHFVSSPVWDEHVLHRQLA